MTLVDDPTDARAFGASTHDAEGLACRRNVLIDDGDAAGLRLRHHRGPAGGDGVDGVGGAGRLRHHPGGRVPGPAAVARAPSSADEILAEVGEGLFVQSVTGVHSGVNPVSGDFSVGAEGLMIRGGRSGRAGARGHHRLDACSACCSRSSTSVATSSGCPGSPPVRPWPSTGWSLSGAYDVAPASPDRRRQEPRRPLEGWPTSQTSRGAVRLRRGRSWSRDSCRPTTCREDRRLVLEPRIGRLRGRSSQVATCRRPT